MTVTNYNRVKVFSATKARERESLGERATEWLRDYDGMVVDKEIRQSSDNEFHCLSMVFFCREENPQPKRKRRRNGG